MKIWEPTKCCCCCNVRTGSIVLSVIFLVGGSLSLISAVRNLIGGNDEANEEFCKDMEEFQINNCLGLMTKVEVGSSITSLVLSIFSIIFSSFLLYGILKQKTSFFIPLMIAYTIQIVLMILFCLAVLILLIILDAPFGAVIIVAAIYGGIIFLQTYFLLCIRAHYLEIKRNKGHLHTALKDTEIEVPPYSGDQVPPYPGAQVPPYPGAQVPPYPGAQVPPYPGAQVPPYPGAQVPPYPGAHVPQYPGAQQVPLYPEVPPYPSKEVPTYPGSDPLLHPSQKN